jgi:hypothetical protein
MNRGAVLTGDITNFTKMGDANRGALISETKTLMQSWVSRPQDAAIFRGDRYQLVFEDIEIAIIKSIQLVCWFKKPFNGRNYGIGTRISVGTGKIAYLESSVLESDGEAFHLSGRNFDQQEREEFLRITTPSSEINKTFEIILMFVNMVIDGWTPGQAEVLYYQLENSKQNQEEIAKTIKTKQPEIARRLRLSHWKEVEKALNYIAREITALKYNGT